MFGSNFRTICMSAVVAAVSATASFAATYDATNVTTGENDHTFYFGSAPFDGGNLHWQFVGGVGTFETFANGMGSFARLTGTILQNPDNPSTPDAANRFEVDVLFKQAAGANGAGVKCIGGNNLSCGAEAATWDYFNFVAKESLLTGVAGAVNGLVLSLDDRTGAPIGQLGESANDKNTGFGFSDWFQWTVTTDNGAFSDLDVGSSGYGDINLNLTAVPLPAGGMLLLTALVGMGAVRRVRKH